MSVTVQGVDVFVRERGAGEPVLFLHGNPDSADIWDPVIAGFLRWPALPVFLIPGLVLLVLCRRPRRRRRRHRRP